MKRWLRAKLRGRTLSESGASPASFALMVPVLVGVLEIVVVGGRTAGAHAQVQAAARQAARSASLARGESAARDALVRNPAEVLSGQGYDFDCKNQTMKIGPKTNYVRNGDVEVIVECTIDMSDFSTIWLPLPTIKITKSAVEPVGPYRVIE